MPWGIRILLGAVLLPALVAAPAQAIRYQVTRLGSCGDPALVHFVVAEAVNEPGVVVGIDEVHDPLTMNLLRVVPFRWDPVGGMVCLEDLPGGADHAWPHDINDNGQIVGHCDNGAWVSCLWESGATVPTLIGDLPGGIVESKALAINNAGQVVGYGHSEAGREAYLFEGGVLTPLGDLPGGIFASVATDVNDVGWIVGYGTTGDTDQPSARTAFFWEGGVMTALGPADRVEPRGLNELGQVVGWRTAGAVGTVIWEGGAWVSHPTHAPPMAINDHGQVVGAALDLTYVWDRYNGSIQLFELLDPPEPALGITYATDINNAGRIVAAAFDQADPLLYPALALDPIPPFDADGDGYLYHQDCAEDDPATHPGATEIADGVDNDCDGAVDEDDADNDGYSLASDCNDNDPAIRPGAPEIVRDGIDQDCNGFDLTIQVTLATWSSRRGTLAVAATSLLGSAAGLSASGYGAMSYSSKKDLWSLSVGKVAANPGSVAISGAEGEVTAIVTTVR